MGRRWAAWSTAARPASGWTKPTSRCGWTSAGRGRGRSSPRGRGGGQVPTGTPISMIIENVDQRSRDYSEIATAFRPGHADYSYFAKYGVRDYRGGGRQSARETAARVAAGAIARKVIPGVQIRGAVVQIGPHAVAPERIDFSQTETNPFWCPDPDMVPVWEEHLEKIRKAGSSTGAVVAV